MRLNDAYKKAFMILSPKDVLIIRTHLGETLDEEDEDGLLVLDEGKRIKDSQIATMKEIRDLNDRLAKVIGVDQGLPWKRK